VLTSRLDRLVSSIQTMTKRDLVTEATKRSGLTRRQAARGVEATLDAMKRALGTDSVVYVKGLGRLEVRRKKSGLLPATRGATAVRAVPPGKAVMLKAARKAVVTLDDKSLMTDQNITTTGGNMDEKKEKETEKPQPESQAGALGLDIGTSRLVLATGPPDQVKTLSELNAFVSVPFSKFTENILKQNKVSYQLNGGQDIQIFGNEAERFANFFNAEVRRPMLEGILNPSEEYSILVMQAIIQQLVRKTKKGETLRFSVPGPLREGGSPDLVYHEAMLKNLLSEMGYNAKALNEGQAVVFAELEEENFSGIGISCGGGMCNVCMAFMSLPVLTFSTNKAGDYIDRSVASVTHESPNRIRVIKEEGLDLSAAPKNKYETALHI
jgi:nucleoid DNA-binding protein